MYTISQVAKQFHLSRSTLLYYDKIKVLQPSARGANKYRLYNDRDIKKLKRICCLREVGIPLKKINTILHAKDSTLFQILNQRLLDLNQEIQNLRNHQRLLVKLLGNKNLLKSTRSLDKDAWVNILRSTGLDQAGMKKWHHEFEMHSPQAHQDFLESLGIQLAEIKKIRRWSR